MTDQAVLSKDGEAASLLACYDLICTATNILHLVSAGPLVETQASDSE